MGKDDWVIGGTGDIVADEVGVYVVLECGARWSVGMVSRRAP